MDFRIFSGIEFLVLAGNELEWYVMCILHYPFFLRLFLQLIIKGTQNDTQVVFCSFYPLVLVANYWSLIKLFLKIRENVSEGWIPTNCAKSGEKEDSS